MAAAAAHAPAMEEDPPPPCDPETLARGYQLEALERALAGNTVAFLETGSGKTLIAVLLLRAYAHRIRSAPPPCFAVFLVPKVVLVGQQAQVIEDHTDLRVAQFYGDMGVDFWGPDTWRRAVDGAEVLVMTPQILLDNLRHCFFRLRDIALLIFDECHSARGNSPYASILKGYIRGEAFDPITWIIPGKCYDVCSNSKLIILSPNMYSVRKMSIKSKRIADSVEALIGAYLSAGGEQAAYLFLISLGMDIEFHKMPVERKITIKSEEFINLRGLEVMLGYDFNDPSLLVEALTHGSYQIAGTTACYQRLEFLGDAVLDHIFTDYFYRQYPECTPELLTDLRSASVNNNCYAHAAVKAGLHKHILHSSSALHKRMADYLKNFKQSFSGPSHGWEAGIGLPKVLGDVIESIAAAIYIDSKCNKEVVWRSMKRLLEPLATPDTLDVDPVKELQELCDSKSYSITYTEVCEDRVPSMVAEVQVKETAYKATRTGLTMDDAKKFAAKAVLQGLKVADADGTK